MAERLRAHWGRLIAGCAVCVAAAFVATRFVPEPALDENRRLAGPPTAGLTDLTELRREADAYVADRFPPRGHLIGALNRVRMLFGVSGSPRVVVGRQGWLFNDDGSHLGAGRGVPRLTDPEAARWLAGLAGRTEMLQARGISYVVLSAPVKEAIYPDLAPAWFQLDTNRPAVTLTRLADVAGAGRVIYPYDALVRQAGWGLKTYSPHDTHWTGLGAYLGYAALMQELQLQGVADGPRPLESFKEVRRHDINKPRNLALMLGVASFVDVDFPELEDRDPPILKSTFITANHEWTGARVVDTGNAGKPVLLMTFDSFSAALLPFLWSHFSRIVLAHNDDGHWRPDLIDRFQPDVVVTEVVESGLPAMIDHSPAATPEALDRIRATVANRRRYEVETGAPQKPGPRTRIEGGEGDDHIEGRERAEDVHGLAGDDVLVGHGGDDAMRGGRGRDRLDGGDGDDWLSGGRDDDTLTGGRGADLFNSFEDAGRDIVTDFSAMEGDRIELDPGVAFTVLQQGADVVVQMKGAELVLRGVEVVRLPRGWIRNR